MGCAGATADWLAGRSICTGHCGPVSASGGRSSSPATVSAHTPCRVAADARRRSRNWAVAATHTSAVAFTSSATSAAQAGF